MTTELKDFKGIYIAPEAALYLKATLARDVHIEQPQFQIRTRNLINWIRAGLMSPELRSVSGRELLISFEDLVSMRVIAILRALGLSWQKIHDAEDWLREKTNYVRPFAVERLWTDTTDIFMGFRPQLIAASRGGQMAFPEMLASHLQQVQDMTFVPHNSVKVADTWSPHQGVTINPRIQFGAPCLAGTRIRTRVINELLTGGDTIAYITRAFQLSENQINYALEWEDRLKAARFN